MTDYPNKLTTEDLDRIYKRMISEGAAEPAQEDGRPVFPLQFSDDEDGRRAREALLEEASNKEQWFWCNAHKESHTGNHCSHGTKRECLDVGPFSSKQQADDFLVHD